MSAAETSAGQPIIIVRRPRGGHDEHHGGAWKIAYADFMTAMMALFLVLWLVNASSEETRAAVASYFNPIELTDRQARPRGLDDPAAGTITRSEGRDDANEAAGSPVADPDAMPGGPDAPASVPSEPAPSEPAPFGPVTTGRDAGGAGETGSTFDAAFDAASDAVPASDAFDPFALDVATIPVAVPVAVPYTTPSPASAAEGSPPSAALTAAVGRTVERAPDIAPAAGVAAGSVGFEADAPNGIADADAVTDAPPRGAVPTPGAARAARDIAAELAGVLAADVEVMAEADTVVIRLADDPARGMFALGSAVPRAGLDAALGRVAASLAGRGGSVSVHGHTDARPFPGAADGNWRLSAERAAAAHALLVAAGLDPARVARVVAHADRNPRDGDALAPRNRRIEVWLALGGDDG